MLVSRYGSFVAYLRIWSTHLKSYNSQEVKKFKNPYKTRSSRLNCALRDDDAVYWVSIGHYEGLAIGNWLYWVSRGHLCLYILHKVEIWTGVTDAWLTTLKDRATQLLIKYKSGALVTQYLMESSPGCQAQTRRPRGLKAHLGGLTTWLSSTRSSRANWDLTKGRWSKTKF